MGEATILDDGGSVFAKRTVTESPGVGKECHPLTRAVGAWATLVLDEETSHAHPREEELADRLASKLPEIHAIEPVALDRPTTDRVDTRVDVGATSFVRSGFASGSTVGASVFVDIEVRTHVVCPAVNRP